MSRRKILRKYDGVDRWGDMHINRPRNFSALMNIGVLVAYGDAFEYKERAFLLVGHPFFGKTSSTGMFVGYNNRYATRLSSDTTTMEYDANGIYISQTKPGINVDLMPVLNQEVRYPLQTIFVPDSIPHYLEGRVKYDTLNDVLSRMFRTPSDDMIMPKRLFQKCLRSMKLYL